MFIPFQLLAQGVADTLAYLGREKANPNASPENNLKLVDTCDCTDVAVCEDVFSDAAVETTRFLESITYEGTVYSVLNPVTTPDGLTVVVPVQGLIDVNDTAAVHAWILKVLSIFEESPGLTVGYDAGTTTFTLNHIGAGELSVITWEDASTSTNTRNCTLGVCCDYVLGKEGTLSDISDDGGATTETLLSDPFNYTGVAVTDAATAATLLSELTTALTNLSVAFISVAVEVDDVAGNFKMTVKHQRGLTLTSDTDAFVECCCVERFFA